MLPCIDSASLASLPPVESAVAPLSSQSGSERSPRSSSVCASSVAYLAAVAASLVRVRVRAYG